VAPKTRSGSPRAPGLPVLVSSQADVGRLLHEIELINDSLLQLSLRTGGKEVKLPKTSRLMDQIVELNGLNLLKQHDRAALKQFLKIIHDTSPVLNISFGVDPSPAFVEKLMTWLRQEIHPLVLMNIGLQPNIGGGCIVRTTNRQFDFSLRQYFAQKRDLLIKQLTAPEPSA
jgi:F0F1-type ATP synthase delta subunit